MQEVPQEFISFLVGLLMPTTIDYIRAKFGVVRPRVAYLLALGICLLMSYLINLLNGTLEPSLTSLLANLAIVFVTSQTLYKQYWENSDARDEFLDRVN